MMMLNLLVARLACMCFFMSCAKVSRSNLKLRQPLQGLFQINYLFLSLDNIFHKKLIILIRMKRITEHPLYFGLCVLLGIHKGNGLAET